ncbi:MAG: hypothetical protein O3A25_10230 [Acidobacteria bacterium]|nr:hypothetical protein [Acidobacteriota bacterium]
MALTCPNCGNAKTFLAKTLQMHVVKAGGAELELSEQTPPAMLELLCDDCETELDFGSIDSEQRREMLLLLGVG